MTSIPSLESGELPKSPDRNSSKRCLGAKSRRKSRDSDSSHRSLSPSKRSSTKKRRRHRRHRSRSSVGKRHRHRHSPNKGSTSGRHRHSRSRTGSLTFRRSRSRSPAFFRSRTRSPARSPAFRRNRTRSPTIRLSRTRPPASRRSRSRSPAFRRNRNRSPTFRRTRTRSLRQNRNSSPVSRRSPTQSPSSRRSRTKERSQNRWTPPISISDRSSSHGHSRSPLVERLWAKGDHSATQNRDLRISINHRRLNSTSKLRDGSQNRPTNQNEHQVTSSYRSPSFDRLQMERGRLKSQIAGIYLRESVALSTINGYSTPKTSPIASDSGHHISPFDAVTSAGENTPIPKRSIDENANQTFAETPLQPAKITSAESASARAKPNRNVIDASVAKTNDRTIPPDPLPPKPVPKPTTPASGPGLAPPPLLAPAVQAQSIIKSILKNASAAKENAFARATRMLVSTNANIQQFYDQVKFKDVVDASKHVLAFLSNLNTPDGYSDSISAGMHLLSAHIRKMLESISVEPSSLTDDQVQTLMVAFMKAMTDGQEIETAEVPEAKPTNAEEVQSAKVTQTHLPINRTANVPTPVPAEKPSVLSIQSADDRPSVRNSKNAMNVSNRPPASASHKPNPRDPRLRANHTNRDRRNGDSTNAVSIQRDPKSIPRDCSATESESDEDCQYVGTFRLGQKNK